jgi:hypothetical protein
MWLIVAFLAFVAFISFISFYATGQQGQYGASVMSFLLMVLCILGAVKAIPKKPPGMQMQTGPPLCRLCNNTGQWFDPSQRLEIKCPQCKGLSMR